MWLSEGSAAPRPRFAAPPRSIDRATLPPRYFPRDVASLLLLFRQIIVTRLTGVTLLVADALRCNITLEQDTGPGTLVCRYIMYHVDISNTL